MFENDFGFGRESDYTQYGNRMSLDEFDNFERPVIDEFDDKSRAEANRIEDEEINRISKRIKAER